MVQAIIILHGMARIITQDQPHGAMVFIGIHIAVGDFLLAMAMAGLAGAFIPIDMEGGDQEDITEDTAGDITEDIEEEEILGIGQVTGQGVEILPEMYTAIDPTG